MSFFHRQILEEKLFDSSPSPFLTSSSRPCDVRTPRRETRDDPTPMNRQLNLPMTISNKKVCAVVAARLEKANKAKEGHRQRAGGNALVVDEEEGEGPSVRKAHRRVLSWERAEIVCLPLEELKWQKEPVASPVEKEKEGTMGAGPEPLIPTTTENYKSTEPEKQENRSEGGEDESAMMVEWITSVVLAAGDKARRKRTKSMR